ncbi:MAG: protein-L-isoaspartate O-methyltransferase family protein, partial [Polymorphobacter sp.]
DAAVALGGGRSLIEPMILGLLLTHLRIEPTEKILIVGAATGYSAAVVAQLSPHVTALEADPALAAQARTALASTAGIAIVEGPLAGGWAAAARYDVVLVDGAISRLSPALMSQLREGGRVGMVLIGADGVGRATVGRVAGGHFGGTSIIETGAAPLPGFEAPARFVF